MSFILYVLKIELFLAFEDLFTFILNVLNILSTYVPVQPLCSVLMEVKRES